MISGTEPSCIPGRSCTPAPSPPGSIAPPYTPASYLLRDSVLTAPQLVSSFQDFHASLEYNPSAPALVFERLVANLSGTFTTALEQEHLALEKCKDENKTLQLSNKKLKEELAALKKTIPKDKHQQPHVTAAGTGRSGTVIPRRAWSISSLLSAWIGQNSVRLEGSPSARSEEPSGQPLFTVADLGPASHQVKQPKQKRSNPVIGGFHTSQVRSPGNPPARTSKMVTFTKTYSALPSLVVGLSELDLGSNDNIRIRSYASDVQKDRFRINVDSWENTKLFCGGCSWLEVEANDLDFQFGQYNTLEDHPWYEPRTYNSRYIAFPRAYSTPPQVVVFFTTLDMNHDTHWHVKTFATNVTATGFTIHIETWDGSVLYSGEAAWVAYPADKPDVCSGTISTTDVRSWQNPQTRTSGRVGFNKFAATPRTFMAVNSLDIDCRHNLRLKVGASSVNASGMNWYIDSWFDTVVYSAGASYIALS